MLKLAVCCLVVVGALFLLALFLPTSFTNGVIMSGHMIPFAFIALLGLAFVSYKSLK